MHSAEVPAVVVATCYDVRGLELGHELPDGLSVAAGCVGGFAVELAVDQGAARQREADRR